MKTIAAVFSLTRPRKRGLALCLAIATFAVLLGEARAEEGPCPSASAVKPVAVSVSPQWDGPGLVFEGWGTALAWFGNVTGRLPDPIRTHVADLLYGDDGLRFNIARYNIGGGNAPETKAYLRAGADIPGFWKRPPDATGSDWWNPNDPSQWDWEADAGQRWWLDAIRSRVPKGHLIFEAFSNSPPYFMTASGLVSGHQDGLTENLRAGYEERFASYLVRVTHEVEQRHHITFRTLSPLNEPNTPYWFAANTQEGAHWKPDRQSLVILAVKKALQTQGMKTQISGIDETNAQTFVQDWMALDGSAIAAIDQINVHSYDTTGKTAVRDIARYSGKRLWMSEVDLSPPNVVQDFDDMRPAIALSEEISSDLNRLEPVAWVLWQAVENQSMPPAKGSNWGLIKIDYSNSTAPAVNITKKYWAMANYSRFIRPGDKLIPVDDTDTVVAQKPDGRSFVLVHTNPGLYARRLSLSWPVSKKLASYRASMTLTDANHHAETVCSEELMGAGPLVVPPMSIATFVFSAGRK